MEKTFGDFFRDWQFYFYSAELFMPYKKKSANTCLNNLILIIYNNKKDTLNYSFNVSFLLISACKTFS